MNVQETIQQCAAASHAGTMNFAEVVRVLVAQGVESYRVDYRLGSSTYFLPSGESFVVPLKTPPVKIGDTFQAAAVVEAIRGSQRGEVKYPQFVERTMAAGCTGYTAWLAGRHVTYVGRRGETHVEHFPT